ncbi:MAG: adenylyl-sulfate kinase, partial [Chlamydiia bacterium]|nr:adenylyl-sulfate kinase [Chlamydiia bacterium]
MMMPLVIVGHVDHGKSTILGRLLADSGALPEGKLEAVKRYCACNSKPFEYAFLLDALKEEQSQGITIDAARCFFKTARRPYLILDAPGHVEFIRNMVTGASHADGALIVIDAKEGVRENTKRHGYFLSLLGVKQVAVLINKMDQADYQQAVFEALKRDYSSFLKGVGIVPRAVIPVSGFQGDNVAMLSPKMPWYQGPTLLEAMDHFQGMSGAQKAPFRFPIQGVYKFTEQGDERRILAGRIETGRVQVGDQLTFYPSGQTSRVRSLEGKGEAGYSTGLTLEDPLFITRGEIASKEGDPRCAERLLVRLFWLDKEAIQEGNRYFFKLGTQKVGCTVTEIRKVFDSVTLKGQEKRTIQRHEIGEVILDLEETIACDLSTEIVETSRFVLVHGYRQSGGGLIEAVLDKQVQGEISLITPEMRAKQLGHLGEIFFLYGSDQKNLIDWAQKIEKALFRRGVMVYTSLFQPHARETYFLLKEKGFVLLLVGEEVGMDLDSSCCLSFPGVDKNIPKQLQN